MATEAQEFHTGKRASESRVPRTFTVEEFGFEKTFRVHRSGDALKSIIALGERSGAVARVQGKDKRKKPAEPEINPSADVDLMYEGISLVLVDPDKDEERSLRNDQDGFYYAKPEYLRKWVDFEVAEEFMELIMPSAGNPQMTAAGGLRVPEIPQVPPLTEERLKEIIQEEQGDRAGSTTGPDHEASQSPNGEAPESTSGTRTSAQESSVDLGEPFEAGALTAGNS